ncbi:trafficking protein particle complex subunit 12-like [Convolutriloba macropyga]|uniref:trafficking protein particle complex subunit 12-like n=1 Tax=Convolutriloba macropyga TaxID=536237 RepID=UPI003F52497E
MYDPTNYLGTNAEQMGTGNRSTSPIRTLRELAESDPYSVQQQPYGHDTNRIPESETIQYQYRNEDTYPHQLQQQVDESNFQSVYMGASVYGSVGQYTDVNDPNSLVNRVDQSMDQLIIDAQYMYTSGTPEGDDGYSNPVQDPTATEEARSVTPVNEMSTNTSQSAVNQSSFENTYTYPGSQFDNAAQFGLSLNQAFGNSRTRELSSATSTITSSRSQGFGDEHSERADTSDTNSLMSMNTNLKEDTLSNREDDRNRMWSFDNESLEQASVLESSQLDKVTAVPAVLLEHADVTAMWIWSPTVSKAINKFMTNPNSANSTLEREQITMPGIIESAFGDPLQDLLSKYTKNVRSRCNSSALSHDEESLQLLIVNENFRAALELTEKILSGFNQGRGMAGHLSKHTVQSIRIWHARFILLNKLKMFAAIESELEYFGGFEKADLSYEYYPHLYPGKSGSMIPFCLRLLWAESPSYCGKYNESLDRLSCILTAVGNLNRNLSGGVDHTGRTIEDSERLQLAVTYWSHKQNQILYSIGNCFLQCMDYSSTLETYEDLLKRVDDFEEKMHLSSAIGRVSLQLGDVKRAAASFRSVETLINDFKSSVLCKSLSSTELMKLEHQIYMNRGLLFVGQNKYKDAMVQFQHIVQDNPKDVVACNNLAVTNVYLGKIKDASTVLDRVMKQCPIKRNTNEHLIQNLSILFGNETPKSLGKKILLLEHVAKYKGDAFATSSLRLT